MSGMETCCACHLLFIFTLEPLATTGFYWVASIFFFFFFASVKLQKGDVDLENVAKRLHQLRGEE